jgi:cytochrome c
MARLNERVLMMMAGTLVLASAPAQAAAAPKPPAFAMCGVCHKVDRGAPSPLGPNLFGVGGRVAGTASGYSFSPAMKNSKLVWNRANLISFISDPRKRVPGTKMGFAGQKNPAAAAAIADYLLSLK